MHSRCIAVIRRVDGDGQILVSTIAVPSRNQKNEPRLVFHRNGRSYFLAQIWNGDGWGRQLFESAQEKEAANSEGRTVIALSVE
jgi:hypothetical protein